MAATFDFFAFRLLCSLMYQKNELKFIETIDQHRSHLIKQKGIFYLFKSFLSLPQVQTAQVVSVKDSRVLAISIWLCNV
jgi:hypothetical protein